MNRLQQFMMGRNGGDHLSIALLIFGMILNLLPFIIARVISLLVVAIVIFRMFSRNLARRQAENRKFLSIWYPVKNFFIQLFKPAPDAKTHKYVKCPKCRQKLRVPRGKGKIRVTCPKCNEQFLKKT